ncbi:MAG: hypothetical protein WDN69_17195 [Aliidongia sp.]
MFAIIEDKKPPRLAERGNDRLDDRIGVRDRHAKGVCRRPRYCRPVGQRRQIDEPDPAREIREHAPAEFRRQPRLTNTTGPDQRYKRPATEPLLQLGQFALAPDDLRLVERQVGDR